MHAAVPCVFCNAMLIIEINSFEKRKSMFYFYFIVIFYVVVLPKDSCKTLWAAIDYLSEESLGFYITAVVIMSDDKVLLELNDSNKVVIHCHGATVISWLYQGREVLFVRYVTFFLLII